MTAAHLVLVWQERDDPNLLAPRRSGEGGRAQSARRHATSRASARVRRTTRGKPPAGPCTASAARRDRTTFRRVRAALARRRGRGDDPRRGDARAGSGRPRARARCRALDLPGSLKTELHASVVELTTDICADVDEAIAALRELRAAADPIARDNGYVLAAAGAHPTAALGSLPGRAGGALSRDGPSASATSRSGRASTALHVHVGVESADRCWERLEAVLPWLPVVLALSVNSPFVDGEPTGMLSNRASILAELPRGGAPPGFAGYDGLGGVGRAARPARSHAGLHARLVGRAPASEARHARGARRRPADRARARPAHRRARARSRRERAGVRARRAPTICRTAGRRRARASTRRCCIRTASERCPRASSRASCSARSRPSRKRTHSSLPSTSPRTSLRGR